MFSKSLITLTLFFAISLMISFSESVRSGNNEYPMDWPQVIYTSDLDNDLSLDLAVVSDLNNSAILLNDGGGDFTNIGASYTGTMQRDIDGADFDGDGALDIAVNNLLDSKVEVFINKSPSDVDDDMPAGLPVTYNMSQNYPNPFNPSTTIKYSLDKRSPVRITVYNLLGQYIKTLSDEVKNAGTYYVRWDGTDWKGQPASSGIYFYHLDAGGIIETKKMMLLK